MPAPNASQRRRERKIAYDAFMATCPSRQLLDTNHGQMGLSGAQRALSRLDAARELARIIAGVSQKMLTQTLRALERDGLLTRVVTPTVPLRVDYALTPLGMDLERQMSHLKQWAEMNMDAILAARRRHARTQ